MLILYIYFYCVTGLILVCSRDVHFANVGLSLWWCELQYVWIRHFYYACNRLLIKCQFYNYFVCVSAHVFAPQHQMRSSPILMSRIVTTIVKTKPLQFEFLFSLEKIFWFPIENDSEVFLSQKLVFAEWWFPARIKCSVWLASWAGCLHTRARYRKY